MSSSTARPNTSTPDKNARFRARYREEKVGDYYSGRLHLLFTTVSTLSLAAYSITRLHDVHALEWLTLPVAFVIANGAEYFGHKGPMHHAWGPLKRMAVRHAGEHHRFYTHEFMVADEDVDAHITLFPPIMMFFFVGVIATPLAVGLFLLFGSNVGFLFLTLAALYLLNYEWLHFAYHMPEDSWLGQVPGVATLRRIHTVHHNPHLMTKKNFNISYPLFDWLMGTLDLSEESFRGSSLDHGEDNEVPSDLSA